MASGQLNIYFFTGRDLQNCVLIFFKVIHSTQLLVTKISILQICKVNMFQGKVMDLFNLFFQLSL